MAHLVDNYSIYRPISMFVTSLFAIDFFRLPSVGYNRYIRPSLLLALASTAAGVVACSTVFSPQTRAPVHRVYNLEKLRYTSERLNIDGLVRLFF